MLEPFLKENRIEAGCDKAGRGCLAGPVVAAAVILPQGFEHHLLNDSKKLTHKQRSLLRIEIEASAAAWAVCFIDNNEIDEVNIYKASYYAMHRAVDQLNIQPEHLLIDGNRFIPHPNNIPYDCIIKGDGKYLSIAAASILAKTHRDEFMEKAHETYPNYDWKSNKGYPTKKHRAGIREFGITPLHRKTFKLLPEQMALDF